MQSLLAIDLPLGPALELALRECAERRQAFCILDQRLSPRRRDEELAALGATSILRPDGAIGPLDGADVDDEIGLVMLTSGSSGVPKAVELTWDALVASAELTQSSLRADTPPSGFLAFRPITLADSPSYCAQFSPTPRCSGPATTTSNARAKRAPLTSHLCAPNSRAST